MALVKHAAVLAVGLLLAACAHGARNAEAPPLENGVHVSRNFCQGEGGCETLRWRVGQPIALRAKVDPAAPVTVTLRPGEWVDAIEGQVRTMPRRGVVTRLDPLYQDWKDAPRLAVGDVVYPIAYEGEGDVVVWRRGESVIWHDTGSTESGVQIQWDPETPPPPGAALGRWVRVKRANGETGWAHDATFECVGKLAGDANCDVK
jgi:hypothetical protein